MDTIFVKSESVERKWYVIDAEGKAPGRVAVKAASLLRGKHKPEFAPHQDIGDFVIIVNAEKIQLSGNKKNQKVYYRHSGYPGGLTAESFLKVIQRKPTFPMERAVYGMLPKGPLGRKMYTHLKVYAGPDHPHAAQKPVPVEL